VRFVARRITLQMEARSNERMRIAGDLHDTLLQGLLSASMQLSVAEDQLATDSQARPLLGHVSSLLRQLVAEGRNAVRGLRMWNFDYDDLEHAIAAVPSDLQIESNAQFLVSVEGRTRALRPAARNEVYLIAREAISNALRHGNAEIIEVNLEYLVTTFQLTVRDNGNGFNADTPAATRGDHFGLGVMNERAERIGGTLTISSATGAGTEIVMSASGPAIYQPETDRNLSEADYD
jgi:signal transduction histidine kinase